MWLSREQHCVENLLTVKNRSSKVRKRNLSKINSSIEIIKTNYDDIKSRNSML